MSRLEKYISYIVRESSAPLMSQSLPLPRPPHGASAPAVLHCGGPECEADWGGAAGCLGLKEFLVLLLLESLQRGERSL